MKTLIALATMLTIASAATAAEPARPPMQMDPAMKEMCDKMMADKAEPKAMKEAGCPMRKKARAAKSHDHSKFHKNQ